MSRKTKLIGWLFVLGTLIQSYLGQVSHVSAEQVAQWGYHEWTGSLLYVLLAGITSWKAYITNPAEVAGSEQRVASISRSQIQDPKPSA